MIEPNNPGSAKRTDAQFNLDQRIDKLFYRPTNAEECRQEVKQLIREVVEAIKPEWDEGDDFIAGAWNDCVDELEQKAKKILEGE